MQPTSPFIQGLIAGNPLYYSFIVIGIVLLYLLITLALEKNSSITAIRHRRYHQTAKNILNKLPHISRNGSRMNYLRKINPYVFEELLLLAFKKQGFKIQRNKRYSGDGGLDGKVWIEGRCFLIQAKRYSQAINAQHVEEFGKLLNKMECEGFFIHTGRTGEKSVYQCRCYPEIHIISGQKLLDLLSGHFIFNLKKTPISKKSQGTEKENE
ncbi:restriction endonuclease [Xenorhabdus khoisanae]|uniref:restriction endonuclease n=1 Tax=Xenorhabdus khoisanae TaxID=880157 RepID=UPI00235916B8|nr:restriction endonuclease [Xenorhabdus khoisanae]MDC9612926.1 restriction endonuclease [Xenorhabdus khoisanae]